MAFFLSKNAKFLAIFPPIFKILGLFFGKLPKFKLLFCQNLDFGILKEFFGYFWGDNLAALLAISLTVERVKENLGDQMKPIYLTGKENEGIPIKGRQ